MASKRIKITSIVLLLIFLALTIIILALQGNPCPTDKALNTAITVIETPTLTTISEIIAVIFDTITLAIISLIIAGYLIFKGSKREGIFFASTVVATTALVFIIKNVIQRARPLNALIAETNFSFPSGHATIIVVFLGLIIYLVSKSKAKEKTKLGIKVELTILAIFVMFTRLYLRVHWLTDVLTGAALGGFILATSIIIFERK